MIDHVHYCSSYLVKELLSGGVWLDGELQLGVDGGDANVDGLRHLESTAKVNA